MKKLNLSQIRTDGGTQVRVELDQATFLDYGPQMKDGTKFPPLDVFHDGSTYWLADGFHRFYGARESGLDAIEVKIHSGTVRDAVLFAIGANATHGKPRSNKDKRHAVEMLLADPAWREWSGEMIAEKAAVSNALVSDVKRELLESKSWEEPETTIGKDGKRRKKPAKSKAAAEPEPEIDADEWPDADEAEPELLAPEPAEPILPDPNQEWDDTLRTFRLYIESEQIGLQWTLDKWRSLLSEAAYEAFK